MAIKKYKHNPVKYVLFKNQLITTKTKKTSNQYLYVLKLLLHIMNMINWENGKNKIFGKKH